MSGFPRFWHPTLLILILAATVTGAQRNSTAPSVSIQELRKHGTVYYGKVVTVDAQIHRILTERVFTVDDQSFLRNPDVLVISTVAIANAVTPLEASTGPGCKVRITALVQPFDRRKLEQAYGPLRIASRMDQSFADSPVLIVEAK